MTFTTLHRGIIAAATCALLIPAARADEEVTYAKHISRIVADHCQECHRPAGIGPFELMTYNDVKGWSKMIKEVVSDNRMPPWFAKPNHLEFSNDFSLTPEEKQNLLSWIDGGMARGDKADMPEPRVFESGWRMGTPDKVWQQPYEITVPAEGVLDYQYVVTDPEFEEDVWLTGLECLPGNAKVVHHIIVYALPPGKNMWDLEAVFDGFDENSKQNPLSREAFENWGSLFIAGFAPGTPPKQLDEGVAKRIKAGTKFLWELHYTPTGKVEKDRSSFGVNFAKSEPEFEFMTATPANEDFVIPPHAANHFVECETIVPEDAYIHAFTPHMHYRGKSFKYTLTYPDGRKEVPLDVPNYDFNWQLTYNLKEPLFIPAGTKVLCEAYFDNSADNPRNPDPTASIEFGEQSYEEMMIGFIDFTWATPAKKETDD